MEGGTGHLALAPQGGNVGIGTTNPGAPLEIRGSGDPTFLINHTGAAGNPALYLQQDGATKAFLWWDQANNRLNLGTPTTNPIISLQNNGGMVLTGSATINGGLGVTGSATIGGLGVTGSATISGGLGVTGSATIGGLSVTGGANIGGHVTYGGLQQTGCAIGLVANVRCTELRLGQSAEPRLALVDREDVLVLNYGGEWPNGVRHWGQFSVWSSRALKENIADVSVVEALEVLAGLQPVTFNFKGDERKILQLGFIAEDVPMAIGSPDRQGVVTSHIVTILTKVVQEQQTLMTQLTDEVKRLEALITPGAA